jgi:hypothetical protein
LRAAGRALPVPPAEALEAAVLGAAAGPAFEPTRPSRISQPPAALFNRAEPGLKLAQRHPWLELNSIHRHTHLRGLCLMLDFCRLTA